MIRIKTVTEYPSAEEVKSNLTADVQEGDIIVRRDDTVLFKTGPCCGGFMFSDGFLVYVTEERKLWKWDSINGPQSTEYRAHILASRTAIRLEVPGRKHTCLFCGSSSFEIYDFDTMLSTWMDFGIGAEKAQYLNENTLALIDDEGAFLIIDMRTGDQKCQRIKNVQRFIVEHDNIYCVMDPYQDIEIYADIRDRAGENTGGRTSPPCLVDNKHIILVPLTHVHLFVPGVYMPLNTSAPVRNFEFVLV